MPPSQQSAAPSSNNVPSHRLPPIAIPPSSTSPSAAGASRSTPPPPSPTPAVERTLSLSSSQSSVPIDMEVAALYSMGATLGKGAYGSVHAAVDKKTKREVAIKIIPVKNANGKLTLTKEKVEQEIRIMSELDHPRILRMYNYIPTANNYNIVMEKVDGGELLQQMLKLKKYTERKACRVIFNLLSALKHMHEKQWMHCDLKPENLLLVRPPNTDEEVTSIKLADFGLSRSVKPDELPKIACGSPLYIAPEVLQAGIQKTRPNYNEKADLWSAGIICFLLLTGMIPFYGRTPDEIFHVVLTTQHNFNHHSWASISDEAKDFVNRLLVKAPEHRMSAAQALKHPWMALSAGPDADEDVALPAVIDGLRSFNAQQKLRGAIYGVEAMLKMKYLTRCAKTKAKPNSALVAKLQAAVEAAADGSDGGYGTPRRTAVRHLDLSGNYLGAKGLQILVDTLAEVDFSSVETLNLTNVILRDEDLELLIPVLISSACKIHSLVCDANELSHSGGRLLLELARVKPQFTSISAARNHIKDSILEKIAWQCQKNAETLPLPSRQQTNSCARDAVPTPSRCRVGPMSAENGKRATERRILTVASVRR